MKFKKDKTIDTRGCGKEFDNGDIILNCGSGWCHNNKCNDCKQKYK